MPGGGTVTIATELWKRNGNAAAHGLPEGDYVVLSIRDEGHGMSPEVRQRATEPFFSTKGKERGTGLGLAMVHGIVPQSPGRLERDSAPWRGNPERLRFPGAQPHEARAGHVQTVTAPAPSADGGDRTS